MIQIFLACAFLAIVSAQTYPLVLVELYYETL